MGICATKPKKPNTKHKTGRKICVVKKQDVGFNEDKLKKTLDEIFDKYDKDGNG